MQNKITLFLLVYLITSGVNGQIAPCLDPIPEPFCVRADTPKAEETDTILASTFLRLSAGYSVSFQLQSRGGVENFAITPNCQHGTLRLHRIIGATSDQTVSQLSVPTEELLPGTELLPINVCLGDGSLTIFAGARKIFRRTVAPDTRISRLSYLGKESFPWMKVK